MHVFSPAALTEMRGHSKTSRQNVLISAALFAFVAMTVGRPRAKTIHLQSTLHVLHPSIHEESLCGENKNMRCAIFEYDKAEVLRCKIGSVERGERLMILFKFCTKLKITED